MPRLSLSILLLSCALLLPACSTSSSEATTDVINPGDSIGNLLITTGKQGEFTNLWELACVDEVTELYCQTSVGTKVNISASIYDHTRSGKLEEVWLSHSYSLLIDDRPVNLQAFGFIDLLHPTRGDVRMWNVVVDAAKPGDLVFHDSGVVHGEPFGGTIRISFD